MGARGPQPTPTRLKLITGNPGRRPLNKAEPKPALALTKPPHIAGAIGAEWDRAIAAMPPGFFTEADVPVLTIYCEALTMRRQALSIIAEHGVEARAAAVAAGRPPDKTAGMVVAGSAGQMAPHPMIAVASKQAEIILRAADRLGMSPAARTRLTAPDEDEADDLDTRYFG